MPHSNVASVYAHRGTKSSTASELNRSDVIIEIRRNSKIITTAFIAVMTVAFLLKAMIPAGFMPTQAKDGMIAMVICSGVGEKTVYIPAAEMPNSDAAEKDHTITDHCPYQLSASTKDVIFPPSTEYINTVLYTAVDYAWQDHQAHLARNATIFTARGPPSV